MNYYKLPAGVQDILPPECRILNEIRERLAQAFEQNGYDPVLSAAVDVEAALKGSRDSALALRMWVIKICSTGK